MFLAKTMVMCAHKFLPFLAGFCLLVASAQAQTDSVKTARIDTLAANGAGDVNLKPQDSLNASLEQTLRSRLANLQNGVPLKYNSRVHDFITYFTVKHPEYMITMEQRRNLYFPIFEEVLKKHNMPDEIKYLSIIESGLNPNAKSWVGAAGLWQFMPYTGKELGLTVNSFIDERLDPYRSTEAACVYLKRLYQSFNDWELALASYNCGPGYVRKAIRSSGYKNSFWEIYPYLPRETRGYVPQFVAAVYTMNHLQDHGLEVDSLQHPMKTETVTLEGFINFELFCEKLDICYDDFRKLNPALKNTYLPEGMSYVMRLPADKYGAFTSARQEILECARNKSVGDGQTAVSAPVVTNSQGSVQKQKILYTVKSGESVALIASKYGTTSTQLRSWNGMSNNFIYPGQKLVIYRNSYVAPANTAKITPATPVKTYTAAANTSKPKYYYVRSGDSLWTISQKNGISVERLKKLNNLKNNNIRPGQKILVG